MFLFAGYRKWSLQVFKNIDKSIRVAKSPRQLEKLLSEDDSIKSIIFVGWSWIVREDFIKSYKCICYHPSDLPFYRGGSPIQHQVIDGIRKTKATLFLMNDKVDEGPIFKKKPITLDGDLSDIFSTLTNSATDLILDYINIFSSNENVRFRKQKKNIGFTKKRRGPEESEITLEDLKILSGDAILRKINVLADPYPNAFLRTSDGKKLLLKKVSLE